MHPECGADHSLWPGIELFRRRSERCRPAIDQLAQIAKDGALNRPLSEIASSLLHMHANRMFRSAARAQEAVVYRFLDQYYDSLLARRGKSRRKRALPRG